MPRCQLADAGGGEREALRGPEALHRSTHPGSSEVRPGELSPRAWALARLCSGRSKVTRFRQVPFPMFSEAYSLRPVGEAYLPQKTQLPKSDLLSPPSEIWANRLGPVVCISRETKRRKECVCVCLHVCLWVLRLAATLFICLLKETMRKPPVCTTR